MNRTVKGIKKDILDKFRAIDGEENDVLPRKWLIEEYLISLNRFERKDFDKAIRQLAATGVVTYNKDAVPELKLTQKGANLIH